MWPLGLLFLLPPLSPCSGCVFCKQPYWHLQDRFYNLCEAYKAAESSDNCTQYPGPYSFNPYGIDEGDLIFITHKTHRVFRMLEITNDTLGIAAYWDWLHEVKLVEYSHKALCPPLCSKYTRWIMYLPTAYSAAPGNEGVTLATNHILTPSNQSYTTPQGCREPGWAWVVSWPNHRTYMATLHPASYAGLRRRAEAAAAEEAAHVYNCTLCQMESMECWSEHTCYPETVYLDDAVVIVEYCGLLCMLLGAIVFSCEYHWQRKRERRAADRDAL